MAWKKNNKIKVLGLKTHLSQSRSALIFYSLHLWVQTASPGKIELIELLSNGRETECVTHLLEYDVSLCK